MTNPVFLTGLGPVCSLGNNYRLLGRNLSEGRSGVTHILRPIGQSVEIAAEIADALPGLTARDRKLDRAAQLAIAAAGVALEDAGLSGADGGTRWGVVLGSSRGAAERLEHWHTRYIEDGATAVGPH